MKFSPTEVDETPFFSLLVEGIYEFEVVEASNSISKNGNDMIKIRIGITDGGINHMIYDYLLEAMPHKLKHFSECVGLEFQYKLGEINDVDCIGRCGRVSVVIEPGKPNPSGGMYPDRNVIKDYVKTSVVSDTKESDIKIQSLDDFSNELNDDIPF